MEDLRKMISDGRIEAALEQMTAKSGAFNDPLLTDAVTLLSARMRILKHNTLSDTVSHEDTNRERNKITEGVLELLPRFENVPATATQKPITGITEQHLKQHILFLTLIVKGMVLVWLVTQYQAGGYSQDQFTGILTLLVPILVTYAGLMFQDFLDHRYVVVAGNPVHQVRIRRSVQWTIYTVILIYGFTLCTVIGMKPAGTINFSQLSTVLALVESFLGIYLSRIVRTFFKEKES